MTLIISSAVLSDIVVCSKSIANQSNPASAYISATAQLPMDSHEPIIGFLLAIF